MYTLMNCLLGIDIFLGFKKLNRNQHENTCSGPKSSKLHIGFFLLDPQVSVRVGYPKYLNILCILCIFGYFKLF